MEPSAALREGNRATPDVRAGIAFACASATAGWRYGDQSATSATTPCQLPTSKADAPSVIRRLMPFPGECFSHRKDGWFAAGPGEGNPARNPEGRPL